MSEQNEQTQALAPLSPTAAPLARALQLDKARLALLTRTLGANLDKDELQLFLAVSARLGLDPFTRQIHAIKDRNGGFFIHVGIDGRRAIAQRTHQADGTLGPYWCGPDGDWKDMWAGPELPVAARVGILKKGCREPFWATALMKNFKRSNKWNDSPEHMLAKVAEDHALRKAFPYEMGGIPTAYRPEHDDRPSDPDDMAPDTLPDGSVEGEYRHVDQVTGEITTPPPVDDASVCWWHDAETSKVVSTLADQLTEAGARFTLPADDARPEDVQAWLHAKRSLLKHRTGA